MNYVILKAWISLYVFLENDYTPAFFGEGKVRPRSMGLKDDNLWMFLVILAVCRV